MHLGTARVQSQTTTVARLDNERVLHIAAAATQLSGAVGSTLREGSMQSLIEQGDKAVKAIGQLLDAAASGEHSEHIHQTTHRCHRYAWAQH